MIYPNNWDGLEDILRGKGPRQGDCVRRNMEFGPSNTHCSENDGRRKEKCRTGSFPNVTIGEEWQGIAMGEVHRSRQCTVHSVAPSLSVG